VEAVREGRHLAAIMFLDMVGYTARMHESEAGAIAAVRSLWDLVRPLLKQHGGREVDLAGDGMLTEFPGALAAVRCALAIHQALRQANAARADAERIRVRCGVHLGDIEHKDGRIYGDGVNIAARVIGLAPPGAVAMTAHVRDQLVNALDQPVERLGLRTLKNIKTPVEIWCVPGPDCSGAEIAAARKDDEGAGRTWTFGNAVLDERTLELTVAGRPLALEKKALVVLAHLVQHAGEVVTKEELIDAAWPGRVISDSALTSCIAKVREALEDDAIKTVHGFGYRLTVPVKVESVAAEAPPRFDFKPGDKPPHRPLWSLVERLGTGGHGEAWLARHDKTREPRVFKFALEASALASLKREITLYRVLKDSLGGRKDYAQILDWNLEEAPYFIESEYANAGNLVQWLDQQGGAGALPLDRRLQIVAEIAEALAAAHSVGVLHKDLKPSNVVVHEEDGQTTIKLCDFGSGGVLDPRMLELLGITRLGFTKTVIDLTDSTSGTPIYLAPEVIAGQPFTVQADIHALGVMLYQMVIGDLKRPLSSGWESDVDDELLREDIAKAAHGNPAKRLPDASIFAQGIRRLAPRRAERAEQRMAAERAERAEKLKTRNRYLTALVGTSAILTAASIGAGLIAYQARDDALQARDEAKAVSNFLSRDVLRFAHPLHRRMKDATLKDAVDYSLELLDTRLQDQPGARADVMEALAAAYGWYGDGPKAKALLKLAIQGYETAYGRRDLRTLRAIDLFAANSRGHEALALHQEVRTQLAATLPASHPYALSNRTRLAVRMAETGALEEAIRELNVLVVESPGVDMSTKEVTLWDEDFDLDPLFYLCSILTGASRYEEAVRECGRAIERPSRYVSAEGLAFEKAFIRHWLGIVLAGLGRYAEAEVELQGAEAYLRSWLGTDHVFTEEMRLSRARLLLDKGERDRAMALVRELLRRCKECSSGELNGALAEALLGSGRLGEALATGKAAVIDSEKASGVVDVRLRAVLADIYREGADPQSAWATLEPITERALERYATGHVVRAELHRVQGLLWLEEKRYDKARAALQDALDIQQLRRGPDHWRTRRPRDELARVPAG
jgi:eukaryotic-like serine/threonine-protein kinase